MGRGKQRLLDYVEAGLHASVVEDLLLEEFPALREVEGSRIFDRLSSPSPSCLCGRRRHLQTEAG
jgi:hypothetical protein